MTPTLLLVRPGLHFDRCWTSLSVIVIVIATDGRHCLQQPFAGYAHTKRPRCTCASHLVCGTAFRFLFCCGGALLNVVVHRVISSAG